MKAMKRRWLVLDTLSLRYFVNPGDEDVKGIIFLEEVHATLHVQLDCSWLPTSEFRPIELCVWNCHTRVSSSPQTFFLALILILPRRIEEISRNSHSYT
jgi:hypothetical protein